MLVLLIPGLEVITRGPAHAASLLTLVSDRGRIGSKIHRGWQGLSHAVPFQVQLVLSIGLASFQA